MTAATADVCPRCSAPFVERDAFNTICALGHSIPARPPAPLDPVTPTPPPLPAPPAPAAEHPPQPVYRSADAIPPARVSWLWPGRLPFGKITLLDGDPGLGKSLLTLDLAARLTTGRPLPESDAVPVPPAHVILLCNEDDPADTVIPRLREAGADISRVKILEAAIERDSGTHIPFTLPAHLPALDALVTRLDARLVVIDPLMAYLDTAVNAHRDQAVRRALLPLQYLAQRRGCAVLLVRHLNKAVGASALYRGGGSIGIVGAARSALLVAPDPVDPQRRLLAPLKSNLASRPDTLAYRIDGDPPRVEWLGTAEYGADALLGLPHPEATERRSVRVEEAGDWLRDRLLDGPRPAADLLAAAHVRGFSVTTLRRARLALGVVIVKNGFGENGQWLWSLPERTNEGGTMSDEPVTEE